MFKTVFAATLAAVIEATQLKTSDVSMAGMIDGMGEAEACIREGGFWDGDGCVGGFGFAQLEHGFNLNSEGEEDVDCDEDPHHIQCLLEQPGRELA